MTLWLRIHISWTPSRTVCAAHRVDGRTLIYDRPRAVACCLFQGEQDGEYNWRTNFTATLDARDSNGLISGDCGDKGTLENNCQNFVGRVPAARTLVCGNFFDFKLPIMNVFCLYIIGTHGHIQVKSCICIMRLSRLFSWFCIFCAYFIAQFGENNDINNFIWEIICIFKWMLGF